MQLSVFVEIICQPVQFLVHFARISKLTMQDIHVKCSINMKYRIPHNYSTYAYKGTVKQFRGFQVTACVYIYLLLYKSIMLWVLPQHMCLSWQGNSNEYPLASVVQLDGV